MDDKMDGRPSTEFTMDEFEHLLGLDNLSGLLDDAVRYQSVDFSVEGPGRDLITADDSGYLLKACGAGIFLGFEREGDMVSLRSFTLPGCRVDLSKASWNRDVLEDVIVRAGTALASPPERQYAAAVPY